MRRGGGAREDGGRSRRESTARRVGFSHERGETGMRGGTRSSFVHLVARMPGGLAPRTKRKSGYFCFRDKNAKFGRLSKICFPGPRPWPGKVEESTSEMKEVG